MTARICPASASERLTQGVPGVRGVVLTSPDPYDTFTDWCAENRLRPSMPGVLREYQILTSGIGVASATGKGRGMTQLRTFLVPVTIADERLVEVKARDAADAKRKVTDGKYDRLGPSLGRGFLLVGTPEAKLGS